MNSDRLFGDEVHKVRRLHTLYNMEREPACNKQAPFQLVSSKDNLQWSMDWHHAVFTSPLSGRDAVDIFECSGKVKLVGITDRISDIPDIKLCQL